MPGLIQTERAGAEPSHRAARVTLVGRQGVPDDVASAVAFFASDESAYVTGTVLAVDGGMTFA